MNQKIQEKVKLAPYTTYQIGGEADLFFVAKNSQELIKTLEWAKDQNIPITLIGGGSNLLISDKGVEGLVILNKACKYRFNNKLLIAESGTSLIKVARESIEQGLSGLDFAANIPGSVGGAVIGNAGAYGKNISQVLEKAKIWDPKNGIKTYKNKDFCYSYRQSLLKDNPGKFVLEATFRLESGNKAEMVKQRMSDSKKRNKNYRGLNCGSYFKNPENIMVRLNNKTVQNPSAGQLIEAAGLKGYKIGRACVSNNHGNVLLNLGDATASDMGKLEKIVIEKVKECFGVLLTPEIVKIGRY